jgi:hypothetical protein
MSELRGVCVRACVNIGESAGMYSAHKYRCLWMLQALDPPGDGVVGAYGPLDIDDGNSTQVLYNSSTCS